jgi:hypothetical protein
MANCVANSKIRRWFLTLLSQNRSSLFAILDVAVTIADLEADV